MISFIKKNSYFYFYINKQYIGKIWFGIINCNKVLIKYITIESEFRGKNLSKNIFDIFCVELNKEFEVKEYLLEAREENEKYGKLEKLYNSWDFMKTSERYEYDNDYCFRIINMKKIVT